MQRALAAWRARPERGIRPSRRNEGGAREASAHVPQVESRDREACADPEGGRVFA
ncbi:hypothetical protein Plo01_24690 [Planobispora longispora]|uniref:Uncharacterized protein n=1 Tax=Planobispora longispora TaxID=28887 RepID=A0A8J3W4Z8_9ACTN|nr:hypothetical protein Plo01_24690 [Planobispora longispora]